MRIFKRNRIGRPKCNTEPRKRTTPTKPERRLQRRIESFNATTRGMPNPKAEGWTRPGSLQAS